MPERPRYTDEQIDASIREFRAGGDPLPPEILLHLSPAQLRRFEKALERVEMAALREWQQAWWNGEVADMPPTGVWAWDTCPDDPSGLIARDLR